MVLALAGRESKKNSNTILNGSDCVAEALNGPMIRSSSLRASGRAAAIRAMASALLVFNGLSGDSLLAQPFRVQTVPPRSPSLEAQRSFQAKIDEQARLLTRDGHLQRVPERKRQALVEFVVGNVLLATTHQIGHALFSELGLLTPGGAEQAADDFAALPVLDLRAKTFPARILLA